MLRTVARLSLRARSSPARSPCSSVSPAVCIATSVPVDIATPTSARASAGASLIPSPTIATRRPCARRLVTSSAFFCGEHSAKTSSIPSWCAIALAAAGLSPLAMISRSPSLRSAAKTPAADGFTGSAIPSAPKHRPCSATSTTVCPCCCQPPSASRHAAEISTPACSKKRALPSSTGTAPTRPRRPSPGTAVTACTGAQTSRFSRAACSSAEASGCSLPCSSDAAKVSSASAVTPASGNTARSSGLPCVSVPVLSKSSVSTSASCSSTSALRMSRPACAPRPVATMIDIGVASPSAHGQAMITTDTALTSACAHAV